MDAERWHRISALYHAALARADDERNAFLADACGGDVALRREIEELLDSPPTGDGILKGVALEAGAALASSAFGSLTGRRLGIYTVRDRIGAGGMARYTGPATVGSGATWPSRSCRAASPQTASAWVASSARRGCWQR